MYVCVDLRMPAEGATKDDRAKIVHRFVLPAKERHRGWPGLLDAFRGLVGEQRRRGGPLSQDNGHDYARLGRQRSTVAQPREYSRATSSFPIDAISYVFADRVASHKRVQVLVNTEVQSRGVYPDGMHHERVGDAAEAAAKYHARHRATQGQAGRARVRGRVVQGRYNRGGDRVAGRVAERVSERVAGCVAGRYCRRDNLTSAVAQTRGNPDA